MPLVFVLNGANINMVGVREPHLYGTYGFEDIRKDVLKQAKKLQVRVDFRQSNHEGDIIDWIHEAHRAADGVILNPGGFTRTSIAIFDAIKAIDKPVIELHLTNNFRRETRLPPSQISPAAHGVISGFGAFGYFLALDAILHVIGQNSATGHAPKARHRRTA